MDVKILGQSAPSAAPGCLQPLFAEPVSAGFPSPAQDFVERSLDLNELCVRRPASTYFVRVEGLSMVDAHIFPGDILIVDRSLTANHGDIVIAAVNGEFTVKELCLRPSVSLVPRNPEFSPIAIPEGDSLDIFGVVTHIIHNARHQR